VTLGTDICEAAGGDCKSSLSSFFDTEFVKVAEAGNPGIGGVVAVRLSDPLSLGSDQRQIGIVVDDDPNRLVATATMDEGSVQAFTIDQPGAKISVWADKAVPCTMSFHTSIDEAKAIADAEDGTFLDDIAAELKRQQAAAREQTNQILIGVAVLAVVIVVAFAYVAPKIKIPKVALT
jgi:hypothetical protein